MSASVSSFTNTWRFELLNLAGASVGDLDFAKESGLPGVQPGAQFDRSANTDLRETAKATVIRNLTAPVDWTQYRIRIWFTGTGWDGVTPVSTLIPTAAPQTYPSGYVKEELELHSSLSLLDEDGPGGMYGVPAGALGVAVLQQILDDTIGAGKWFTDPSDLRLNSSLTWDAGTSWLTICNKIATTIGFFALKPDPMGVVRAERYIPPGHRPMSAVLDDGPHTSMYGPGWTRDVDLLVPNRVVVVQKVEGDNDSLVCEAVLPSSNPRSAAHIGRTITKTYAGQDFVDVDAGTAKAIDLLSGLVPAEKRTLVHPWMANVKPGAVITHSMAGVPPMVGTVQSQSVKLQTDGLVTTEVSALL